MKPAFFARSNGKSGYICIYQEIGESWNGGITALNFADTLKEIGNVESLDIYVNSPGGNVFDGVAIYNQLKRFNARKVVHIDGLAASIASVICMAGDEIHMANNAQFMIHDPWGVCVGTAQDMRKNADTMDQVRDTLIDTYVAKTKGEPKQIQKWMADETWMRASEAKERGFIDVIEDNTKEVKNFAFPILAKFKNTPKHLSDAARNTNVLMARMQQRCLQINRASPATA